MSMKALVNHPQWEDFMEWVDKEADVALSVLVNTENDREMYRVQGVLKLINKLKVLKSRVNSRGVE